MQKTGHSEYVSSPQIDLFNAIPTKISGIFLVDIEKIILKFTW